MTLGWSSGPHSITMSDQLIRCWTAGMVARDQHFLLFLWLTAVSSHTAELCGWLACRSHCETCMVHLAYHSWCMVAELDPAELGPAVSPQVFASDCLPQSLDPPVAGPLLPAGCHTGHPAAHLFSY